ncbi:hypothetical protein EZS27_016427 [termite gut metagenome]|uniref:Uncharacterized protein n=1 Tax=termite gut metagenome TaxID=433724 RepID=A0A5J4RN79_9ZZZZ
MNSTMPLNEIPVRFPKILTGTRKRRGCPKVEVGNLFCYYEMNFNVHAGQQFPGWVCPKLFLWREPYIEHADSGQDFSD